MAITLDGTNIKRDGIEYPAGRVEVVDTLTAFTALTPSNGSLRNYDGTLWVYDVSSTATEDSNVIAPDSGTGRWIRQQAATGPVDAFYEGVRTTNAAATNTANLNAALAAAVGGTVEIAIGGRYPVNGQITIPRGAQLVMAPNAWLEYPASYSGIGVLLQGHGEDIDGPTFERGQARHIINVSRESVGWYHATAPTDTASIGIQINTSDDMVIQPRVRNFWRGVDLWVMVAALRTSR